MAAPKPDALKPLGPWPNGVNNMSSEESLPEGSARKAENILFDRTGNPRTRAGRTLLSSANSVHSLVRLRDWPTMLVVVNGTLSSYTPDHGLVSLVSGLSTLKPLCYELVNDRVYWSNGDRSGIVTIDNHAIEWGVTPPAGVAALTPLSSGGMPAGTYQVAITNVNVRREESGATIAGVVTVPEQGGFRINFVPQPADAELVSVRVYATHQNGGEFYRLDDVPIGTTQLTVGFTRAGKVLDGQFLDRVPPCYRLTLLNGVLYFAYGHTLGWTEPMRYGLTSLLKNRIGFNGPLDLLIGVGDGTDGAGLYVAARDRTYWLPGGSPKDFRFQPIGVGAVAGTGLRVPGGALGLETNTMVPYWLGTDGVACVGLPGGVIQRLRPDEAVAPTAQSGVSFFREKDGLRHVITSLSQNSGSGVGATDRVSTKIIRNGVIISS